MNYYLTGIQGLPKLLNSVDNPVQYFKKNVYNKVFDKIYSENLETLDAIENGYNSVLDPEQFITHMSEALISHAVEMVESCPKKSKKERQLLDLNFIMAVFVFPVILQYNGNSSQPLVNKLLEGWKREFPKTNLSAAGFETIEKGFHKKWCYITTAVCESFGKADDCYELRILRDYRDTYLEASDGGTEMIREYYDLAPSIVKHINHSGNASEIYQSIWNNYLSPCISMIENSELEECRELYKKMVYSLRDRYFYQ